MIPAPNLVRLACLFALGVATVRPATLNDGTTTNRLAPVIGGPANASTLVNLVADVGGFLRASQSQTSFSALHAIWYARNALLTNGVYRASAEFRPASVTTRCRGGIAAWLDAGSSNAVAFRVVPVGLGSMPASFQVFRANLANTLEPETFTGLYNLDGSPAAGNTNSAWCDLGPDYRPADFATFELEFALPRADDLEALATATARITARVLQVNTAGTATNEVSSRSIELLTDLPVPSGDTHRVGYYGVWAWLLAAGDIGHYRNLSAEGSLLVNQPPVVTLTSPTNGAIFATPAAVALAADAQDPEGALAQVEFFAGNNSIASFTQPPYQVLWSGAAPGTYTLTAVATDQSGESAVSAPVTITVTSGEPPEMEIRREGNDIIISWDVAGYQLQYQTALGQTAWIDVPNSIGVTEVTLPASTSAQYFRLVGSGVPAGPSLDIQVADGIVSVTWPGTATGYRLQAKTTLLDEIWTDLQTTGNSYSEPATGLTRFYRLISP